MALEVQIGANNDDLERKIAEAEILIKNLRKDMAAEFKIGNIDAAEKIQAEVNQAKASLKGLQAEHLKTAKSTDTLNKSTSNGGNTLMQFSRIAQDAPFGIMGIGNNITATVEAFGHLKNSTGSAGGALKAVAGSIMGSGGILLAVSLVTSALTYMSQNNLTVGDVLDKVTGNFDNLKKAMIEVANEAKKSAGAEIANMNALVAISKDENNTRQDRLNAVKKLQEEYPAYFGNLTKEQILNGDVAAAVRMTTIALIEKAKAGIIANKIAENDLKLLQEQQKGQKEIEDFTNRKGIYALLNTEQATRLMNYTTGDAVKTIDNLKKEQSLLTKELEKSTKATVNFDAATEKVKSNAKAKKETTKRDPILTVGEVKVFDPSKLLAEGKKEIAMFQEKFGDAVKEFKGMPIVLDIPLQPTVDGLAAINPLLQEFNQSANDLIQGSITDTFGNLGTAIGEALQNGGSVLSAVGTTLLQGMASFLSDMGGLLIKYGTLAVVKGKLDLSILSGGSVSIAAGLAAIGVGILLKAAGGALGSAAKGGGSTSTSSGGSSSSGGGYNGGYSASSGGGGGTYVFEIAGQKLIGVLQNTLNANSRLGGSIVI
jgi:hypothetical protein